MNYLTTDIYQEFRCIAGVCPNTCCAGWQVSIDKETGRKMAENERTLGILAKDWLIENGETMLVKLDGDVRCLQRITCARWCLNWGQSI